MKLIIIGLLLISLNYNLVSCIITGSQYNTLWYIGTNQKAPSPSWTVDQITNCDMRGVTCDPTNSKVISIEFGTWYTGTTHNDYTGLIYLETLYYEGQGIGTDLAKEAGTPYPPMPPSLISATFINTSFSGDLDPSIATPNLKYLKMVGNRRLTSIAKIDFTQSPSLTYLNIANNIGLTSKICTISPFTNVGTIIISGNKLTGPIPPLEPLLFYPDGSVRSTIDLSNNNFIGAAAPLYDCISKSNSPILNLSGNSFGSIGTCSSLNLNIASPTIYTNVDTKFLLYGVAYNNFYVQMYDPNHNPLSCQPWQGDRLMSCNFNFMTSNLGHVTLFYGPVKIPITLNVEAPFIYSITPYNSLTGGSVTIGGYNLPDSVSKLSILIDGKPCQNLRSYSFVAIGQGTVICDSPIIPNVQGSLGNVTVQIIDPSQLNSLVFTGPPITSFLYQNIPLKCPGLVPGTNEECSNFGKCVQGLCVCDSLHTGFDCSISIESKPNVLITIVSRSPKVNAMVGNKNLTIEITSINEMTLDGKLAQSFGLETSVWSTYIYDPVNSVYHFSGTVNNGRSSVTATIQVFSHDTSFTFGNDLYTIAKGSVKFSLDISTWFFSGPTNTLEIIFSTGILSDSSSPTTTTNNNDNNDNNNNNNPSKSNNGCKVVSKDNGPTFANDTVQSDSLQFASIKNDAVILNTRFMGNAVVDGRSLKIRNRVVSFTNQTTTYGISVPYYNTLVQIDPDFSVVLGGGTNDVCSSPDEPTGFFSSTKKLSFIVAGSFVAVATCAGIFIYRGMRKKQRVYQDKLRRLANLNTPVNNNTSTTFSSSPTSSSTSSSLTSSKMES